MLFLTQQIFVVVVFQLTNINARVFHVNLSLFEKNDLIKKFNEN